MLPHLRRLLPLLLALSILTILGVIARPTATGAPATTPSPDPVPAYCRGAYRGDTSNAVNHREQYTCRPNWPETGPEHSYQLTTTSIQTLTLTLSHPAGFDLDLFLLENGDAETCQAADATLHAVDLPPGDHLIIIDGFDGSQGEYILEVDCTEPPFATPLPTSTPAPTPTLTPTAPPTATPLPTATATQPHLTFTSYLPAQYRNYPPPTPNPLTITLQPGIDDYSGATDTYLDAWAITANYANVDRLSLRQSDVMAPLLHFDLGKLPANAHIVEARLALWTLSQTNTNTATVGLYALHRPWQAFEATWQQAAAGALWTLPGANAIPADRSDNPSSSQPVTSINHWYEWELTAIAQQWLQAPETNHGVILKALAEPKVQYTFASAEYHNPAARPKLTVRYWTP